MTQGGQTSPCRLWKYSRRPRRQPVKPWTTAITGTVSFWETSLHPTCGWMRHHQALLLGRNPSQTCLQRTLPPRSFRQRSSHRQPHPHCRHRQAVFPCPIRWRPRRAHQQLLRQHHQHPSPPRQLHPHCRRQAVFPCLIRWPTERVHRQGEHQWLRRQPRRSTRRRPVECHFRQSWRLPPFVRWNRPLVRPVRWGDSSRRCQRCRPSHRLTSLPRPLRLRHHPAVLAFRSGWSLGCRSEPLWF